MANKVEINNFWKNSDIEKYVDDIGYFFKI